MLDITHQNFEAELINASMQQPVLLDIWAPWCGPCKTLGPVLEKLETRLRRVASRSAKLNADEQPEIASQLSQMFGVRSIPFCVLFKGGQPVDGFVGALPEGEVRKFLDKHVPSAEEMAAEEDALEAEELLAEGDTASALEKLQAAVATNPANDGARYDYLRALLNAGDLDERAPGLRAGRLEGDARRAAGRDRPLDRGRRGRAEGPPGRHAGGGHRRQQARLRRPLRAGAAPLRGAPLHRRRWTSCSRS